MISISGLDTRQLEHVNPHQRISYKGSILLYNKSNIDIWNINTYINVGNFDHVVVE